MASARRRARREAEAAGPALALGDVVDHAAGGGRGLLRAPDAGVARPQGRGVAGGLPGPPPAGLPAAGAVATWTQGDLIPTTRSGRLGSRRRRLCFARCLPRGWSTRST